jgi:hypothetical protein
VMYWKFLHVSTFSATVGSPAVDHTPQWWGYDEGTMRNNDIQSWMLNIGRHHQCRRRQWWECWEVHWSIKEATAANQCKDIKEIFTVRMCGVSEYKSSPATSPSLQACRSQFKLC